MKLTTKVKEMQSFKKGGSVKKTGVYKLHKGEKVMKKKMVDRLLKKKGLTKNYSQ